ncbi:MAG: FHA domain-containing protein [Planctomycetes bacterium]|nr:FHA domain-containing protein [Planctomycetota bacterium]
MSSNLGELVPCGGGDSIPLLKPRLLIGRRSSCDIALEYPNVSSHHCELELINGYWYVRDVGSRNGIKVNGHRCTMKWLLPGDELTVARHRYEIAYTPQGDRPPPDEDDEFAVSLMEKAGLIKRKAERSGSGEHRQPPSAGKPAREHSSAPGGDDDEALRWLNEAD